MFTRYFNIAYPFRRANISFILYHLRRCGEAFADTALSWLERQTARANAADLLP